MRILLLILILLALPVMACESGPCIEGIQVVNCSGNISERSCECSRDSQCDDANDCTDDMCIDGQCTYENADGIFCNDDNPCTLNDICNNGVCSGFDTCKNNGLQISLTEFEDYVFVNITDEEGNPTRAEIVVMNENGSIEELSADNIQLTKGKYQITAKKPGYRNSTIHVEPAEESSIFIIPIVLASIITAIYIFLLRKA